MFSLSNDVIFRNISEGAYAERIYVDTYLLLTEYGVSFRFLSYYAIAYQTFFLYLYWREI